VDLFVERVLAVFGELKPLAHAIVQKNVGVGMERWIAYFVSFDIFLVRVYAIGISIIRARYQQTALAPRPEQTTALCTKFHNYVELQKNMHNTQTTTSS
jgi:hypothetical protein